MGLALYYCLVSNFAQCSRELCWIVFGFLGNIHTQLEKLSTTTRCFEAHRWQLYFLVTTTANLEISHFHDLLHKGEGGGRANEWPCSLSQHTKTSETSLLAVYLEGWWPSSLSEYTKTSHLAVYPGVGGLMTGSLSQHTKISEVFVCVEINCKLPGH